jgi:CRP-like cAMP-binding protein
MTDHTDLVEPLELFAGCSRHERELIVRLSSVTDLAARSVVCAQDEPGECFYVLVDGEVDVAVDGRSVAVLGPGCGFGELALLQRGGRRTAVVTATTRVRLLVFTRPEFATLVQELPAFARRVQAESHRRLAATAT